jgi:putative transposase
LILYGHDFLRNALARVPKASAEMAAVTIRTIFAQHTPDEIAAQVDKVAATLKPGFLPWPRCWPRPRGPDRLPAFPVAHWRKLWSTNPLERLNKELKRTKLVGIFSNDAAVTRLATAVLIEAHDEWQIADRLFLSEASMVLLKSISDDDLRPKEVRRAPAEFVAT